jgi:hypothetical protein
MIKKTFFDFDFNIKNQNHIKIYITYKIILNILQADYEYAVLYFTNNYDNIIIIPENINIHKYNIDSKKYFLIESSFNEVNNNSPYYYFWDCKNNYMFRYNGKVIIEIKSNLEKIWKISTIKYSTCKIIESIISNGSYNSSENNILVI